MWMIGLSINRVVLLFSLLATTLYMRRGKPSRRFLMTILMAVIVMALSMWISSVIYDYSADGQWYHMPAAYALSHGWNPVYVHHNPIIAEAHHANLWIDHYSKGMETLAATVIALTGNVELGKAVNMIMLLATLCLSFSVLRNPYFFGLSLRKSIFYSLVIDSVLSLTVSYSLPILIWLSISA